METAVCSPASLVPLFDAMASPADAFDVDFDNDRHTDVSVSHSHFATTASSHGDDDMKGSDGWRLASDASTVSSRVTTPDPVPPPPPRVPLPGILRAPFAGRAVDLPTPSVPPPPTGIYLSRRSNKAPDAVVPPQHDNDYADTRGCSTPQNRHPVPSSQLPPHYIPPPPFAAYGTRFLDEHGTVLPPPPPPPPPPPAFPSPNELYDLSSLPQETLSSSLPLPQTNTTPTTFQQTRSLNNATINGRQAHRPQSKSEYSDSSLSSRQRLEDTSWSSDSSSQEDPVAYRNARQFPPSFPARPRSFPSVPRSRSLATNRIKTWVSQYEKSQSPMRTRSDGTGLTKELGEAASQDNESAVSAVSSYAEVELLWQQLKEKRARLGEIKAQMAERREELRRLRRQRNEADNAFMSLIRPMLVSQRGMLQTSVRVLDSRIADMQDLRDEYHARESDYEILEQMMDDEEKQLNDLETRFFSLLAAGQTKAHRAPRSITSEDSSHNLPHLPIELRGIASDKALEDVHPLYVKLTSAVGDLENAREELEDLFYVNHQYEFEAELKKTTGKSTTQDMEEFFEEFPAEEARMRAEVIKLENKVQRLKKVCEDKGVMRKHMSLRMAYALDPNTKFDDMELEDKASILARHKSLAHDVFPELLSQPNHVLAQPEPQTSLKAYTTAAALPDDDPQKRDRQRLAAKEYSIDSFARGQEGGGTGDLVNRWLLQQLRLSRLNVQLLHSTFVWSRSLKIRNLWRWQHDVIFYWWRDNTVDLTEGEIPGHRITTLGSDYSSRLGTPEMSRAASDGQLGRPLRTLHRFDSDDAITVGG
ncbi:hypothetical protein JDV02_008291 [Purpureocillium takamizusanense]|uniref:Uncharacterized protein n=1 Tax=Purpureocillium takamizusanense TaxID=2060973 RepID=A0A9Q8VD60_9HYPO|nr:uncharacterized protein JDV02_008291 [Purpureocillium takamizusanense]UNI22400.1 hypothetical protein JDV02_008291 [Purpureocillium takamizusanense]